MTIQKDRLLALIAYAQESARLRSKPVASISEHKLFAVHEHQLLALPGIQLNTTGSNVEDEVWLTIQRLRESKPPEITSQILRPWVTMTQGPVNEPQLLESVRGYDLIAAGTHRAPTDPRDKSKSQIIPERVVTLQSYDESVQVRALFRKYVGSKWVPWSAEEKLRRKTIRLYSELFTLNQQLEGGIVEAQLEIVLGVGIGIWNHESGTVSYPLVSRLVELSLNSRTAEIEIRPRDVDARLEIDWYASVGNPGVPRMDKAAREFFQHEQRVFSPFELSSYEPLLRTAASILDADGVYWPNESPTRDRTIPRPDETLKVTDTWVLFARPRTNSVFLQDLETLKKQAAEMESYPPAVAALITDPDTTNPAVELPSFRGVSASYHTDAHSNSNNPRDLYFPLPFNEEQVRIVQFLEVYDGVVVQGPPGTGKTHTIANVICHYLAEGKRVLVTSMKEPALAVLHEKLPREIRPLAISLLASEHDGMKQFRGAIEKIAYGVQSLDRVSTARHINQLEESIESLHAKLSLVDRKIRDYAKVNLTKIQIDEDELDPLDAAKEVIENAREHELIPDAIGIADAFILAINDEEIIRLREARRQLGHDIDYIDSSVPPLTDFPDSYALLQVHQDLSQFEKLKHGIERGEVPAIADSSQQTLALAQDLLLAIEKIRQLRLVEEKANQPWTSDMKERLRQNQEDPLLRVLESLGNELEAAAESRKVFVERPVDAPPGMELDSVLVQALRNLAEGKSAFGLAGVFGKSEQKSQIRMVRVLGVAPTEPESWTHASEYLSLLSQLRTLALRWNTLAGELPLAVVPTDKPEGGLAAARIFALYRTLEVMVSKEESAAKLVTRVFPTSFSPSFVSGTNGNLTEIETALRHHLTKGRLANVWARKEEIQKVLEGRSGRVIEQVRDFFANHLGNPRVTDLELQASWTTHSAELSRVRGLCEHLDIVREICEKIRAAGAPEYATLLRQPPLGAFDELLPENLRKVWWLRRLTTHLDSIDSQSELKKLAKERHGVESRLARAYENLILDRTWLKLAENASPKIRAALQAYLSAIQKSSGTGVRSARYRNDARIAAAQANPAVPCWIMAHYRVSESLPPEFGCFDLVVIDEASQSDLSALPSMLRAKKVLIVGDDKQVSPEGVGLEEKKIESLMSRFLGDQVETFRSQMSPMHSVYNLASVVFAKSAVMLKEHFRCVAPIIEYSKREFYNHELRPLRLPKASTRLDPPLIDVLIEDGFRKGDTNLPEARFIVNEIKEIVSDPRMANRSIGVVSLIGDEQPFLVWQRLSKEIGLEAIQSHRITCGDARTFQGKERDIMFLSMVAAPNESIKALSGDMFAQRFNVASSRAKDRMYLVRSVDSDQLSSKDKLRRSLIAHFASPFVHDESRVADLRTLCESPFELEMYDELTRRGYWVTPQVRVGQYRIDLVVEGNDDARIAVECDGDRYHGPDKWMEDMSRQRVLERAGWSFWRCFASTFVRRRKEILDDLYQTLKHSQIEPLGTENLPRSVHTEHRRVSTS